MQQDDATPINSNRIFFTLIQGIVDDNDSCKAWEAHCQRHFQKRLPNNGENWRDLFYRCERERDSKIEKITKKIKKHEKKATPARQARIVDQQLPGGKSRAISSKTVITKTVKNHIPTGSSLNQSTKTSSSQPSSSNVVIGREIIASNGSKLKPKTAPLMQKSMMLFKSRFRR